MRLIDADALNLDYEVDMADDWKTAHEIANHIRYAPVVEAIPVEWLLNNIPNDSVMWEYNRKLIEYLVIGWREENETDNLHECG